jgi:polyisoprenoid-binding protein YceI
MTTTGQKVHVPQAGTYRLDPGMSSITFQTRHLFGLGKVAGTFQLASATIQVGSPLEASKVDATVDAASYSSGSAMRDKQVRSKKFLAAEEFPEITFSSTDLRRVDSGWVLEGLLTVRGRSAPLSLTIEESLPQEHSLTLVATTRVDRYAYGIRAARGMAARHLDITLRLAASADRIGS